MMWIAWLSWRSPPRCSRWRLVLPELAGVGGGAGVAGEARVGREPLGAGGVADDDRGGDRPAAVLAKQRRAVSVDQCFELYAQLALRERDLTDSLEDQLRDADLCAAR